MVSSPATPFEVSDFRVYRHELCLQLAARLSVFVVVRWPCGRCAEGELLGPFVKSRFRPGALMGRCSV